MVRHTTTASMWRLVVVCSCALATAVGPEKVDYSGLSEQEILDLFAEYQVSFGKSYADEAETSHRLSAFRQSLDRITLQNKIDTAIYGLTKFSDLTLEEFWSQYGQRFHHGQPVERSQGVSMLEEGSGFDGQLAIHYDTSFTDDCDWREPSTCNSSIKSVLTPVVNQNNCGGCYAYAAIETLASRFALDGYDLTPLSVSQILDCDTESAGCSGGDTTIVLEDYLKQTGSWSAADYPDTAAAKGDTKPCPAPAKAPSPAVYFNTSKIAIPWPSQLGESQGKYNNVIAKLLREVGPVAACMNSQYGWLDYVGGVMTNSNLCQPFWSYVDHCVNIVGYRASAESTASQNGYKYWVVRNSWGPDWGNDGFLYIDMESNVCGVLNEISYTQHTRPGKGYKGGRR